MLLLDWFLPFFSLSARCIRPANHRLVSTVSTCHPEVVAIGIAIPLPARPVSAHGPPEQTEVYCTVLRNGVLEARWLIKPAMTAKTKTARWKIRQFGMGWSPALSAFRAPWAYNKLFDKLRSAPAFETSQADECLIWARRQKLEIFAKLMMIGRRVTQTREFPTMSSGEMRLEPSHKTKQIIGSDGLCLNST